MSVCVNNSGATAFARISYPAGSFATPRNTAGIIVGSELTHCPAAFPTARVTIIGFNCSSDAANNLGMMDNAEAIA